MSKQSWFHEATTRSTSFTQSTVQRLTRTSARSKRGFNRDRIACSVSDITRFESKASELKSRSVQSANNANKNLVIGKLVQRPYNHKYLNPHTALPGSLTNSTIINSYTFFDPVAYFPIFAVFLTRESGFPKTKAFKLEMVI